MDAPTPRKRNNFGCLVLVILPCLTMLALHQTGVTRKFEVEVLGLDWNFEEIVDYIGADYPEGAVDIEYESSHFDRGFFIEVRFKAPPDDAMKFAESICDGVLYQGYDPFDTIDGRQPSPNAHLIFGSSLYYSVSPNASPRILGYRCRFHYSSARWEYIRVDTSNPNRYQIRYELQHESVMGRYSKDLSLSLIEYVNPTTRIPFMIVGLMSDNGEYILVGEAICFETRKDFETPLTYTEYPREFIGKNVVISVDDNVVVDTTISFWWVLAHPDPPFLGQYDYFNHCVYQRHWQPGTHTITLHVDMPDFQDETWTFEVK